MVEEFTSKHSLGLNQHNLIIMLHHHRKKIVMMRPCCINDILRSKQYDELDKLPGNIIKVGDTCQKYNIGKIYISAILPSTRTNISIF